MHKSYSDSVYTLMWNDFPVKTEAYAFLNLLDVVFTTGSTVAECSKALHASGVKEVHVLTLARVAENEFCNK